MMIMSIFVEQKGHTSFFFFSFEVMSPLSLPPSVLILCYLLCLGSSVMHVLLCYGQTDGQKSGVERDQVTAGRRHAVHSHT